MLVAIALSVASTTGWSAPADPRPPEAPPLVAVVADAGFITGLAAGPQLDLRWIGLRATAGYMPLIVALVTTEGDAVDLNFFNTAQLNLDLFSHILEPRPGARIGVAFSYRYNTLLHHGAGVGFDALVALRPRLALHIIAGLTVYPAGNDQVEAAVGPFSEASFPGPSVQGGASVGLGFGLF